MARSKGMTVVQHRVAMRKEEDRERDEMEEEDKVREEEEAENLGVSVIEYRKLRKDSYKAEAERKGMTVKDYRRWLREEQGGKGEGERRRKKRRGDGGEQARVEEEDRDAIVLLHAPPHGNGGHSGPARPHPIIFIE